jgi:hypothetical protein
VLLGGVAQAAGVEAAWLRFQGPFDCLKCLIQKRLSWRQSLGYPAKDFLPKVVIHIGGKPGIPCRLDPGFEVAQRDKCYIVGMNSFCTQDSG